MIYFTSDLHFNHNKEFIYAARGFLTVQEMNDTIVSKWNSVVQPDDTVYVLGDLGLGGGGEEALSSLKQYIERLNGTIQLIYGNHDTISRAAMYVTCKNIASNSCYATILQYQGFHFYLSHYPTLCGNYSDGKSLKTKFINLCGHTHTTDPFCDWDKGIIYHVECDAHDCYPVSMVQILEDIKERLNE